MYPFGKDGQVRAGGEEIPQVGGVVVGQQLRAELGDVAILRERRGGISRH